MFSKTPVKLLIGLFLVVQMACVHAQESADPFVRVDGLQFSLDNEPYHFVGTNMWYAAYIGRDAASGGDRDRLIRELDFLKAHGITNLRLLGASERSPLKDSMSPAISYKGAVENEDILIGLDFALAEMKKRDMKAVIFLNNFWEWSGGMGTYLSWVNGGKFIDLNDPETPWPAFALFGATFYTNDDAVALFNQYLTTLIERRNSVTGELYRDDPTIMTWQLANEPRPGNGEVSRPNLPGYYRWIGSTAGLIKSLAPKQLVSIGSEGTMGCLEMDECFLQAHRQDGIDYATFHMWVKNWSWYDALRADETFGSALEKANSYITAHVDMARQLNMPIVLEEFGIERDGGDISPGAGVAYRDRFFRAVFKRINASALDGGPLVGSNFWAWGGFGRAMHPDFRWREGDLTFVGDPPQEPQGLNSVFAADKSTLEVLKTHADVINPDYR